MTIDLGELEEAIATMTRRQDLYRVLKRALSKRGYWRSLPRGDPHKGFEQSRSRDKEYSRRG